jgi:hypothetical protein
MATDVPTPRETPMTEAPSGASWKRFLTGEWVCDCTTAQQRRIVHYWLTILWFTVGLVVWIVLRDALWFVGFMSLYAIWITHLAGWAAETPVEAEEDEFDAP